MQEILPGIWHWTQRHPRIGVEVSSYYFEPEQVLIDPLIPAEGLDWFASRPPQNIYLSIRHHYRHCAEFAARFGCQVWCVEQGMHEFAAEQQVHPFRFGDMLPGGVRSIEIDSLCPDEGALFIAREGGCVVLGDGCVRRGDGPLRFVSDRMMGEEAAGVKAGLRAAYERLIDGYEFDHLLFSHGLPWLGDGRQALAEFISQPGQ